MTNPSGCVLARWYQNGTCTTSTQSLKGTFCRCQSEPNKQDWASERTRSRLLKLGNRVKASAIPFLVDLI
jgi:hypothetical protein